jgi:hypothetical protein
LIGLSLKKQKKKLWRFNEEDNICQSIWDKSEAYVTRNCPSLSPKQVTRTNCVNVSVFDSFMFCEYVQWYVSKKNTCLNEVDMQNSRFVVVTLSVDVEKTWQIAA